jgi:exodeoxyribonuclease V alpha subunit
VHLDVNYRARMTPEFLSFARTFSGDSKNYEEWFSRVDKEDELCPGVAIRRWRRPDELQSHLADRFVELFGGEDKDRAGREAILDQVLNIEGKRYSLDRLQILTPYRTGLAGASGLNFFFQDEFRVGREFSGGTGEIAFKLKDKVMHTHNEYEGDELFVSNGSLESPSNRESNILFSENSKKHGSLGPVILISGTKKPTASRIGLSIFTLTSRSDLHREK